MNYWQERLINAQEELTRQSEKKIEKQLKKYYETTIHHAMDSFEATYNKIKAAVEEGREPTPADLYKLDKYWELQAQVRGELQKLGDKAITVLSHQFETYWFHIYYALELDNRTQSFNTLDKAIVNQMINQIWCADGLTWSQRVWNNMDLLRETLNQGLIEVVAAGKSERDLKDMLMERFGVSYNQANTLVRTEIAHIQTQAAKKRYEDYGLKEYEILGNEDDTCNTGKNKKGVDCHELHGKKFFYTDMIPGKNAPPFHPRCRCCILPVVD